MEATQNRDAMQKMSGFDDLVTHLLLIKLSKMWPELQHLFSRGGQQAINTGGLSAYTCAAA